MDAPESPGTQKVVGVLSRGEDTDGETSDLDVDYPSESFVSQLDDEGDEQSNGPELEVTGEGTASGPFGLKKVLFVRKKSGDKSMPPPGKDDPKVKKVQYYSRHNFHQDPNKPQESFKDRVTKLGSGVTERFAALGSMMQDHGKADRPGEDDAHTADPGSSASSTHQSAGTGMTPSKTNPGKPRQGSEHFHEYEITFTKKPDFFVIPAPEGKGTIVAWADESEGREGAAGDSPAETSHAPPAGTTILAVGGESVVDAEPAHILSLIATGGEVATADGSSHAVTDGEESESAPDESSSAAKDTGYSLVIRFREHNPSRQEGWQGGPPGSDFFRNRVKAMATGFGSLFQVKETAGGAARDPSDAGSTAPPAGSSGPVAVVPPDLFVLTFAVEGGKAAGLPFTLTEMVGGRGVAVSSIDKGFETKLVRPSEDGVSAVATSAVAEGFDKQGKAKSTGALAPGAVVLRVAGQPAEGKSLEEVQLMLNAVAAEHSAVKILFRCAPPIYRPSAAAQLAVEVAKAPHVHIGTWQPLLKRRAGVTLGGGGGGGGGEGETGGVGGSVIGIGYGGEEWEDVRETMARAQHFVNGFRSCGIRVDVINMQTVTLPRNVKSAYAGMFESRPGSFQQAVRLWFTFPDERTLTVERDSSRLLGLVPVEPTAAWALGNWVTVTPAEGSPCAEAGIPVGENSILTHVNGLDVSPPAYRSLAPPPSGGGEGWTSAVLPILEGECGNSVTLTLV